MFEELEKKLREKLAEEFSTGGSRSAIGNTTQNTIKELSKIIDAAFESGEAMKIREICDEHLLHSKDSVTALYISGMIALKQGAIDNSALVNLVDIFNKNKKEAITINICESILQSDENNKFALRVLAECYRNAKNLEKMWPLYEKIVKIDFDEADMAKALAERDEANENIECAVDYYKKAISRFIKQKNFVAVKEVWSKLILLIPKKIDYFFRIQKEVEKNISADRSAILMQELYDWYKQNQEWETAIVILKTNLRIDKKDVWARKELVECYRNLFSGHKKLEEYIATSDLTQNFRDVFEAIGDFEKHIAFSENNFVFHRTWGVGEIKQVQNDILVIDFGKKTDQKMKMQMAENALTPLKPNHIWVLKAKKRNELFEIAKNDKKALLSCVIKSFDEGCDFKRIKAELVPSIVEAGDWSKKWGNAAKKILEEDLTFGRNPNNIEQYIVCDYVISRGEKYSNEFKAQKQFFSRLDIMMKYVADDSAKKDCESFSDMYQYFVGFIKNIAHCNEQVVAAYLVVQKIGNLFPAYAYQCKYTFAEIYKNLKDPRKIYENLKDTKKTSLKSDFLQNVKLVPDWEDQYIKLFPVVLKKQILLTLKEEGFTEKLEKFVFFAYENFRDYRNSVVVLFKECQDELWYKNAGVSYEKQLITLLKIVDICFLEIENHVNTNANKKTVRDICDLLFKNNALLDYIFSKDEQTVSKMYTLVNDIKDLNPALKTLMRNKITEEYPQYKFPVSEEKSTAQKGMLVTLAKLEEKRAEAENIQKVELPAIAKEIGEARAQGDLKENAEYKAAKEHQHFLNERFSKLQEELSRAVVFDPTTVSAAYVSFGTKVTLLNCDTNENETYTIMGPWESDPQRGIISYMSPRGNAMLDKKMDENFSFTINERCYNYKVLKIETVKL